MAELAGGAAGGSRAAVGGGARLGGVWGPGGAVAMGPGSGGRRETAAGSGGRRSTAGEQAEVGGGAVGKLQLQGGAGEGLAGGRPRRTCCGGRKGGCRGLARSRGGRRLKKGGVGPKGN
ncbi:glycine-rich protein 5-like [Cryptomeria japonica]|uniref:glycine-rich protein 5-like n=1 Tax=Cryptomeria japonica TaxID=3369 RepID=UPI0027DA8D43|nr:glycine-rich protein 5-like [Cryptomeria japonica]